MIKKLGLILLMFFCQKLDATTIFGNVINENTNKKLGNVNIYCIKNNLSSVSNEDGTFKIINCPKEDTVIFSCLGFEELRIEINNLISNPDTIRLKQLSYQLEDIKISSILPKQLIRSVLDNYSNNYSKIPIEIDCNFNQYTFLQNELLNATMCHGLFVNYFTSNSNVSSKQNYFKPNSIDIYLSERKYGDKQFVYTGDLLKLINLYNILLKLYKLTDSIVDYNISTDKYGQNEVYKFYFNYGKKNTQKSLLIIDKNSKAVIMFMNEINFINSPIIKLKKNEMGLLARSMKKQNIYFLFYPYNNTWYINSVKTTLQLSYQTIDGCIDSETKFQLISKSINNIINEKYDKKNSLDENSSIINQVKKFPNKIINKPSLIPKFEPIESFK